MPRFTKAGRRVLYKITEFELWATERTFSGTAKADAAA